MAPCFDSTLSSLICTENDENIFTNGDDYGDRSVKEEFDTPWQHRNHRSRYQEHSFGKGGDFLSGFPMLSDDCLALMVEREIQHLPCDDYLKRLRFGDFDLGARKEIVDWIGKVNAHFNFGPHCAYLSINYLDRFLSAYELPKGKAWMMQLLGVACLSLAAKMEETEVPLSIDLQVCESKFVFEAKTIQRMELLVLSTLKWRMQAVTPFSYIDFFLYKFNADETTLRTSILQSIQIILSTIKGIDFLEYRPSEFAAAVAISVAVKNETLDIDKAISLIIQHVEKDRVLKCIESIHVMSLIGGSSKCANGSVSFAPRSPIGVLDGVTCLSYKSDDTNIGGSFADSSHNISDSKRRKLNMPYEDRT